MDAYSGSSKRRREDEVCTRRWHLRPSCRAGWQVSEQKLKTASRNKVRNGGDTMLQWFVLVSRKCPRGHSCR